LDNRVDKNNKIVDVDGLY